VSAVIPAPGQNPWTHNPYQHFVPKAISMPEFCIHYLKKSHSCLYSSWQVRSIGSNMHGVKNGSVEMLEKAMPLFGASVVPAAGRSDGRDFSIGKV